MDLVRNAREAVDLGASFVHILLLIVICATNPDTENDQHWGSAAGICLIAMQLVAVFAHLFYYMQLRLSSRDQYDMRIENFTTNRNLYKWAEYAISATLGTAAVYLSATNPVPTQTVALLVTLSITIQTVGVTLDRSQGEKSDWSDYLQWVSAAAGQGADFGVVYDAIFNSETLNWTYETKLWHYVPYVLGWSCFGILCLVSITVVRPQNREYNYNIELAYSVLSLISKAFVFGATGHFLEANAHLVNTTACV